MYEEVEQSLNVTNYKEVEPASFADSMITIGNFDGVHLGHQAIIKRIVQKAQAQQNPVVLVTFYPNPADFFNQNSGFYYLSTPDEKITGLLALGVNKVVTFQFDRDFASLSAQEFLSGLKKYYGLSNLVVGHDFVMGKNRQGTLSVVQSIGKNLGFSVEAIQPVKLDDVEISSTKIRLWLDKGNVSGAAKLLGRPYAITGEVIHGADRGSAIGLPTANITYWQKKKLPAVGVYATHVRLQKQKYFGITNIGYRPTFESQGKKNIETHILDFDGYIYGEDLQLQFIKKIRDEQKFSGVETFLAQIERDKRTAQRIFCDDKP